MRLRYLTAASAAIFVLANPALAQDSGTGYGPVFTPPSSDAPIATSVQAGDILYLSGATGSAADGSGVVAGGIEAETRRIFEIMGERLAPHGLDYGDLFKCTVMLADMAEWPAFNEIYREYFEEGRYPARSAFGANGLARGASVELECWAWNPQGGE